MQNSVWFSVLWITAIGAPGLVLLFWVWWRITLSERAKLNLGVDMQPGDKSRVRSLNDASQH